MNLTLEDKIKMLNEFCGWARDLTKDYCNWKMQYKAFYSLHSIEDATDYQFWVAKKDTNFSFSSLDKFIESIPHLKALLSLEYGGD